jgi:hypothetical protein
VQVAAYVDYVEENKITDPSTKVLLSKVTVPEAPISYISPQAAIDGAHEAADHGPAALCVSHCYFDELLVCDQV